MNYSALPAMLKESCRVTGGRQNFTGTQSKRNKCSAIAEMGDRLATIDMAQNRGCAPFWAGELGPHVTQCGLGRGLPSYQVPSWSIQPFDHNRHRSKFGAAVPLGRGWSWVHLKPISHHRLRPDKTVLSGRVGVVNRIRD